MPAMDELFQCALLRLGYCGCDRNCGTSNSGPGVSWFPLWIEAKEDRESQDAVFPGHMLKKWTYRIDGKGRATRGSSGWLLN